MLSQIFKDLIEPRNKHNFILAKHIKRNNDNFIWLCQL